MLPDECGHSFDHTKQDCSNKTVSHCESPELAFIKRKFRCRYKYTHFSRFRQLQVITWSFDWLIVLFVSFVTDFSDYFAFRFTMYET